MAIGDSYCLIFQKLPQKFIYKFFGILDLHSHIRLKPLIHFFKEFFNKKNIKKEPIKILELGCGDGINAFEIYKIAKKRNVKLDYTGVDFSVEAINNADKIAHFLNNEKTKFSFLKQDAIDFLEKNQQSKYDFILLIDIIEHIPDPQKLIHLIRFCLTKESIVLVSVPTPLYPKIFGKKFHKKIGHLVNGYSIESLDELFYNEGYEIINIRYNTGLFSNIGCWLYYNVLKFDNKYFHFFKHLVLLPFIFLDFFNNSKISCSLFASYKLNEKK